MSEDSLLVTGIASRDPEAFRTLMERYAFRVINLAFRFLGKLADAEDVAQDVFFRLYQHPPHLAPSDKLFAWLYRVTVNRCLDLLRKHPKERKFLSLEEPPANEEEGSLTLSETIPSRGSSPRDQLAQAELAARTRSAVASLPASLRSPLILSLFEELSHQEISQILGISPKAVERRISRARDLLKSRLLPYL